MLIRPIENSIARNSFILPPSVATKKASTLTSEEIKMNAQILLFSFGYSAVNGNLSAKYYDVGVE